MAISFGTAAHSVGFIISHFNFRLQSVAWKWQIGKSAKQMKQIKNKQITFLKLHTGLNRSSINTAYTMWFFSKTNFNCVIMRCEKNCKDITENDCVCWKNTLYGCADWPIDTYSWDCWMISCLRFSVYDRYWISWFLQQLKCFNTEEFAINTI